MTIKNYKAVKSSLFATVLDNLSECEKERWNASGTTRAYLAEITEGSRHEIMLFTAKTQINSNVLAEMGYGDKSDVRIIITLDKQTKCAYFAGGESEGR